MVDQLKILDGEDFSDLENYSPITSLEFFRNTSFEEIDQLVSRSVKFREFNDNLEDNSSKILTGIKSLNSAKISSGSYI